MEFKVGEEVKLNFDVLAESFGLDGSATLKKFVNKPYKAKIISVDNQGKWPYDLKIISKDHTETYCFSKKELIKIEQQLELEF